MAQYFGGAWTLIKLDVLQKYLEFYFKALKNQNFKFCYIDAFAGSGEVTITGGKGVPGSTLHALNYPFDKFIFIDSRAENIQHLKSRLKDESYTDKDIIYHAGDCNDYLKIYSSFNWRKSNWRGIIFLDPFAMELQWSTLKAITKTGAFDVWYLFPLMAMNRLLRRDGKIPEGHREILNNLLGTTQWEAEMYKLSPQLSLFAEETQEKVPIEVVREYVIKRLRTIFPAVSPKAIVLRSERTNTPLFLLCFATSNPSYKATGLALRGADYILSKST